METFRNDPTIFRLCLNLLKKEDWDVVAGTGRTGKMVFFSVKYLAKIANALIRG
jgi:hypothetical protein